MITIPIWIVAAVFAIGATLTSVVYESWWMRKLHDLADHYRLKWELLNEQWELEHQRVQQGIEREAKLYRNFVALKAQFDELELIRADLEHARVTGDEANASKDREIKRLTADYLAVRRQLRDAMVRHPQTGRFVRAMDLETERMGQ